MVRKRESNIKTLFVMALIVCSFESLAAGGKLLGTAGVSAIEGGAGGGLLPWATIASYATRDEVGAGLFATEARVDDYNLSVHGVGLGFYDRVELSFAHQDLYSNALSRSIRQNISGVKVRLFGDLVFERSPLISAGLQYKKLLDDDVTSLVGAKDGSGTDVYVSVAKAWLNGPFSRVAFVNANLRYSEANEQGLLGYGGDVARSKWLYEAASGVFLSHSIAVGVEYRQKRNHLSAIKEDNWADAFIAWFPNKSLSITAAYLDLGEIVSQQDQTGFYVSLQGAF